jgi:phosphoglycolate phosphatase
MIINKNSTDLIIFDLDGTLVDTFDDITAAVNYAFSTLGLPSFSTPEVRKNVGNGARVLIERLLCSLPDNINNVSISGLTDDAVSLWKEYYIENPSVYARLYPGVKDTLDSFADMQIRLCIISNKVHEVALRTIENLGLLSYFDYIIGEGSSFPVKPSPDALLFLMKKYNTVPSRTWMIGDGEADIMAGAAAGCHVCGVTHGVLKEEKLRELGAEYIVDSFENFVNCPCY